MKQSEMLITQINFAFFLHSAIQHSSDDVGVQQLLGSVPAGNQSASQQRHGRVCEASGCHFPFASEMRLFQLWQLRDDSTYRLHVSAAAECRERENIRVPIFLDVDIAALLSSTRRLCDH